MADECTFILVFPCTTSILSNLAFWRTLTTPIVGDYLASYYLPYKNKLHFIEADFLNVVYFRRLLG